MTIPPALIALQTLQSSSDQASRLHVLRSLKNDIIGHASHKQLAVRHGLLPILRDFLIQDGEPADHRLAAQSVDNDIFIQSTLIIASLAHGGTTFLGPLQASGVYEILLRHLSQHTKSSSRLAIAILRALTGYVSVCDVDDAESMAFFTRLSQPLVLRAFVSLLTNTSPNSNEGRVLICLVCRLVNAGAQIHEAKTAIVSSGVVSALQSHLGVLDPKLGRVRLVAAGELDSVLLSCILDAISAVINNSPYLTFWFLLSPSLSRLVLASSDVLHTDLPKFPFPRPKPVSKSFPARTPTSKTLRTVEYPEYVLDASDPFRQWLLIMARELRPASARASALRLLARVNAVSHTTCDHPRQKSISLLAIPLVVKLIRDASVGAANDQSDRIDDAPRVLADLIGTSTQLQNAAADAGAVKFLCVLLKSTFKSVQASKPTWMPDSGDEIMTTDPSCLLDPSGIPDELMRTMKTRESCLLGLRSTAIVNATEMHLDPSIISCIGECLTPISAPLRVCDPAVSGNSTAVILAACALLREVAKVTSQARTSLVDAVVAKPLMQLLKHDDIAVKTAATWVCSNLLTPISSVRQELLDAGIIQVLIDHARTGSSKDPMLQQASLWALRHLAADQTKELRLQILEGLGSESIMSALGGIATDALRDQRFAAPNAAHESVDLLHMQGDDALDEMISQDDEEDEDDDALMTDILRDEFQSSKMRSTIGNEPSPKEFLRLLYRFETNQHVRAMREQDMLQNQVLLLLANLCLPPSSDYVIDHLDSTIGLGKLLDIIHATFEAPIMDWEMYSSLRRWRPGKALPKTTAVSNQVIFAAMKLLCHLAGSSERYLTKLIEHKGLMAGLVKHLTHSDSQTKVLALWTVLNLTLQEVVDVAAARRRASELLALGVEERIKSIMHDPDSQDVCERAKSALRQFDHLK